PSDPALAEGIRLAKMAAALGQDDPVALTMAASVLVELGGEVQAGVALIDRALALNPNSAYAWRTSGQIRTNLVSDSELAIAHLERSSRLSPLDPWAYAASLGLAGAHFTAGRYEEASTWADKALHEGRNFPPALRMKAATCGLLGRLDEGREWVKGLLAANPDTTISGLRLYYGVFKPRE